MADEMSGDGVVTAWNPDATALFGWPPDEAVGRTFEEMVDAQPGERPPRELTTSPAHAPWQGTYAVVCQYHPQMVGALKVTG